MHSIKPFARVFTLLVFSSLTPPAAIAQSRNSASEGVNGQQSGLLPLIVAHRGLLRHAPENTLPAFRACLELGFGFELDVRRCRDGQLVCVHDETVDRTSNGQGRVAGLSLADLKSLDVGSWFDPDFQGAKVPTVEEIFREAARYKARSILIAIDLKGSDERIEADVVALAKKHSFLQHLIFIGRAIEHPDVRRRLKQADRAAMVARLASSRDELSEVVKDPTADWVYVRFMPTLREVQQVHQAGKRLFMAGPLVAGLETANWKQTGQVGIDALLTDYPLKLREARRASRAKSTQ